MRVRHHHGFGHGLKPGTDHDINCPSCTRERAEGITPDIDSQMRTGTRPRKPMGNGERHHYDPSEYGDWCAWCGGSNGQTIHKR